MLSLSQVSNAASASVYYQADNYYAKNGEHEQGQWYGQAANDLELGGQNVDPDEFVKILSGDLPNDQSLYRMVDGERKHIAGYDMTFSAPKSVSIMSEVIGDRAMSDAHDEAVKSTLDWVESNVLQTRKFNKTAQVQEAIGDQKMIAALFKHDISRNEDPQLHTHCVVANAVLGNDGKYRSLHSPELFRNKMLIGSIYRSELAMNIQEAKLASITRTHPDGRFELSGFDRELISEFSTRSKDIAEYLGEGAHSAEDKALAALRTRDGKKETSRTELNSTWQNRLTDLGYSHDKIKHSIALQKDNERTVSSALKNALEHLSENSSTFSRKDVLRFTLAEGLGAFRIDEAEKEITKAIKSGWLNTSADNSLLFTQGTLDREKATLDLEQSGRLAVNPIMPRVKVRKHHAGFELTQGQHEAAKHILTSPNRTIGVQGYAGTGKTFMLASVSEQAKEAGYNVLGLAPTSNATKTLGDDANINSQTLQSFLQNPSGNHKTVLLVDEASLISTQQMMELLTAAQIRGFAKLVLIGDSKQLEGASAGAPFRMLQQEGMRHTVMDDIKRQKKERHLEAVKSASKGEIERAFKKLGTDVREAPLEDLSKQTAEAWLKSSMRDRAAIVVTTNKMAKSVNVHVKNALLEEGIISKTSHEVTQLKSIRLSEIQKRFSDNYIEADFVRFSRTYKNLGIRAGETLKVKKVRKDGVVELVKDQTVVEFKPNADALGQGAVEAFRSSALQLNEGDKIRWTKPDHSKGIRNMDQGTVAAIREDTITFKMSDGRILEYQKTDSQLHYLGHAWAQTGHAYQGQTIDHIIAAMPSLSGLTDQKSFYVDISRARQEVTFLTDNVDRLRETLKQQTGEEKSALDLLRERQQAIRPSRLLESSVKPSLEKPIKRSVGLSL